MNLKKLLPIFVLSFSLDYAVCHFYTTPYASERLVSLERKLVDSLNGYFEKQQKNDVTIDHNAIKFVKAADLKNTDANQTRDSINPVGTFHLLRRVVLDWPELKKNLTCDEATNDKCPLLTGEDVINAVLKREGHSFPNDLDITRAIRAILNVWTTYDLDLSKIINGDLGGTKTHPLSADDIFFIANAASDFGKAYESITLYEYLLKSLPTSSNHDVKMATLVRRLASAYHRFQMTSKAVSLLEKYSKKDPGHKGLKRDLDYFRNRISKTAKEPEVARFAADDTSKRTQNIKKYEDMCRMTLQTMYLPSNLSCFNRRLYQFYGVAKVERLSRRPRIEIVYDVVADKEIDTLKTYAKATFPRAMSDSELPRQAESSPFSIQSAALCEGAPRFPKLFNLTRRLVQTTHFNMFYDINGASSLCYSIVNEGVGAIQKPVVDYWKQDDMASHRHTGNQMATVMLQLSDVTSGGAMVFPMINMHVPVVKGSAVVWWNLKSDGTPNPKSTHIRCPVMVGRQWAAYKHVLFNNQMFRRLPRAAV